MSNAIQEHEPPLMQFIEQQEDRFSNSNIHGLTFDVEKEFAFQQIKRNSFTLDTARKNRDSVKDAIRNVAAIGLSLNPANAHAYLVPRDGGIMLDVSYRGMIQIALESGAVEYIRAQMVYECDDFQYNGPDLRPDFKGDPFGNRPDVYNSKEKKVEGFQGVYAIAKLASGSILCEAMSAQDIYKTMGTSKAKTGPWLTWFSEMAKKTVIKRLFKTLPLSTGQDRADKAVLVVNEHEGLAEEYKPAYTPEQHAELLDLLNSGNGLGYIAYTSKLDERVYNDLYNSAPKGEKTSFKTSLRDLEKQGHEQRKSTEQALIDAMAGNNASAASEIAGELSESEREYMLDALPHDLAEWVIEAMKEMAA